VEQNARAMGDTIIRDRASADQYDEQARTSNWLGPEVIFGLVYEFIKPGESVLDIGIGSGLSSILFHQAGLRVFGLDGSSEVLQVCASKHFTTELKLHDLSDLPLPYPDRFANHLVCVAVLNSFEDLAPLFQEFVRIVDRQGILAFTVEEQKPGQTGSYAINRVEVGEQPKEETAVRLYRHSQEYIADILDQNGFDVLKSLEFVAFKYPAENTDVLFKAYIARKVHTKVASLST
jgi:predicted TPR repeat methyltransferase